MRFYPSLSVTVSVTKIEWDFVEALAFGDIKGWLPLLYCPKRFINRDAPTDGFVT